MKLCVFILLIFSSTLLGAQIIHPSPSGGKFRGSHMVTVKKRLPYCQQHRDGLFLDLARPKGPGPFPLLILIHGGSWMEGGREYFARDLQEWASQGFVTAAIDYILTVEQKDGAILHRFPAHLYDVQCALRWLKQQTPTRSTHLLGFSAGAHLALMAAVSAPNEVNSVVSVSGVSSPKMLAEQNQQSRHLIQTVFGKIDKVEFEPGHTLGPLSPPILSFHGGKDHMVQLQLAQKFDQIARQKKARHQLVIYPEEGHGLGEKSWQDMQKKSLEFFKKNFAPNSP